MPDNPDDVKPEDASTPASSDDGTGSSDPNDEIPVPPAMSAAEIDERAQVVEALRGNTKRAGRDDDPGMKG